ncbi:hypothetical protein HHI36_006471, partial [Cryptolaemus montrouzieri]
VYKSGVRTMVKNYRPISLISCLAKFFVKCLKKRLVNFFDENEILSKEQFGFREGCSTEDAMNRLISEITSHLNSGKKCTAVFIDLAKAFNTVPHDRLLNVLWHYGVRGTVWELFRNYLYDRQQAVRINGALSSMLPVEIGIPQGTVLGLISFLAYIKDLLFLDLGGSVTSYADDTAIAFWGATWKEVKSKMCEGLKITKTWLDSYKLPLNLEKTNYIAFSLPNASKAIFTVFKIDNQFIKEVAATKYLGVIIDQFLKWKPHMEYLSNRIRKLIHKFYLIRQVLGTRTLFIIYKSLIESLIKYGILVWGGLYENALYRLNVAQKYILKIIFKKKRLFPTKLLFNGEIVNIKTLYMVVAATFIQKNKVELNRINQLYTTRSNENQDIVIPISHKHINHRSIACLDPNIYNRLPTEIKQLKTIHKFKVECKKFIHSEAEYLEKLFK